MILFINSILKHDLKYRIVTFYVTIVSVSVLKLMRFYIRVITHIAYYSLLSFQLTLEVKCSSFTYPSIQVASMTVMLLNLGQ